MAAGRQLNNNDAKRELKKIQERMTVINAQLQRESLNENMANVLSKELMKISRQAGALARAVRRNRMTARRGRSPRSKARGGKTMRANGRRRRK